jgi:hypothetical protein
MEGIGVHSAHEALANHGNIQFLLRHWVNLPWNDRPFSSPSSRFSCKHFHTQPTTTLRAQCKYCVISMLAWATLGVSIAHHNSNLVEEWRSSSPPQLENG